MTTKTTGVELSTTSRVEERLTLPVRSRHLCLLSKTKKELLLSKRTTPSLSLSKSTLVKWAIPRSKRGVTMPPQSLQPGTKATATASVPWVATWQDSLSLAKIFTNQESPHLTRRVKTSASGRTMKCRNSLRNVKICRSASPRTTRASVITTVTLSRRRLRTRKSTYGRPSLSPLRTVTKTLRCPTSQSSRLVSKPRGQLRPWRRLLGWATTWWSKLQRAIMKEKGSIRLA